MKTLIQKELRENLKLALPALLILGGLLGYSYHASQLQLDQLVAGFSPGQDIDVQPLLSPSLLTRVEYFCAVFGAALGWLQIFSERHRDLWAFMVHRPMSRNRIFAAKVIAGISLYTLGTAIPMLALIFLVQQPGRIAAPFEWEMALPLVIHFMTGLVWYFAGMLTGLRQARWYATRLVGLLFAWVICLMIWGQGFGYKLGQTEMFILIGGSLLAMSAWGSFRTGGRDAGQPKLAVTTLGVVIALACTVAGLLLIIPVENMLLQSPSRQDSVSNRMGKDGVLYRVTQKYGQSQIVTDLAGAPAINRKTGQPLGASEFDSLQSFGEQIDYPYLNRRDSWRDSGHFFCKWRIENGVVWYWNRNGTLLGFDARTRLPVGTVSFPDGRGEVQAFLPPSGFYLWYGSMNSMSLRTLATPSALYAIDLDHHSVRALLTADKYDKVLWYRDISTEATVVLTRHHLWMVDQAGRLLWKIPYVAERSGDSQLFPLDFVPGQYALWINRIDLPNGNTFFGMPAKVLWIARDQGIVKTMNMPVDKHPDNPGSDSHVMGCLLASLAPPLLIQLPRIQHQPVPSWVQTSSLIGALIYGVLGGWLVGRRYRFKAGEQLGWAVFNLAFGLPGFLAFLAVHDWPAREACPNCQKLRLVDRKECEHCGAEFPQSPRLGIEIFEPIGEAATDARDEQVTAVSH